MKVKPRIYWDSDCFISRIQRTDGRIEVLEQITNAAQNGACQIITSSYALVEVVKFPGLGLTGDEEEELILDFFENPYIITVQPNRFIASISRGLTRNHNIKPKDAVHIASAIFARVPVMHTYDQDNHKLTGALEQSPLRIEAPLWPLDEEEGDQASLFDKEDEENDNE